MPSCTNAFSCHFIAQAEVRVFARAHPLLQTVFCLHTAVPRSFCTYTPPHFTHSTGAWHSLRGFLDLATRGRARRRAANNGYVISDADGAFCDLSAGSGGYSFGSFRGSSLRPVSPKTFLRFPASAFADGIEFDPAKVAAHHASSRLVRGGSEGIASGGSSRGAMCSSTSGESVGAVSVASVYEDSAIVAPRKSTSGVSMSSSSSSSSSSRKLCMFASVRAYVQSGGAVCMRTCRHFLCM